MSNRPTVLVEGSVAHYRASGAGMCQRALAGMRMGMDPLAPTKDALRRFADGHLHEDPILAEVEKELGQDVVRRQEPWQIEVSSRVVVTGHIDGITSDDLMPVEAKSAARDSFKDWERSPEKWFAAHPTYADQWTLTLAFYERTTGVYAVKNKDSGLVMVREIPAPGTLAEVKKRLLKIDLDGRRGILPPCDRKSWICPMRFLHDDEDQPEEVQDEKLEGLCRSYREAKEAADRAEGARKELLRRIEEAMGDRDKVKVGTYGVSMIPRTWKTLDKEKLVSVVGDLTPFEIVKSGVYARVTERKVEGEDDGEL